MQTDITTPSLTLRPVGPIRRIGRLFYECDVVVEGFPDTRKFQYFSVMDRRQARRLSRRLGRKFRMVNGHPTF